MIEWKKFESGPDTWEEANYNGVNIRVSQYATPSPSAGKWYWSAIGGRTHTSDIAETRADAVAMTETLATGGESLVRKHDGLRLLAEINRLTRALTQLNLEPSIAVDILPGYKVGRQAGYDAARREIAQALGMTIPDEGAA